MNWERKTLDQLGLISRGRSKHRPRNDPQLFGGKYPFIQTADVKNANFYITEYSDTYNDIGLAQSKLWDVGTLCITIAANIADTGILGIPACFPDSVMGFIPYEGISDVRFVKYCFDMLQRDCKQISQGTAQDNLSWQKLSTIKFPAPPIEIQSRIADILSAYDDLIENNQKQIKLLEEAAQRLYKEWFVDLHFPGYEHTKIVDGVPEGWKACCLDDVIEFDPKVHLDKNRMKQFVPMSALSTSSMVLDINEISKTMSNSGSKFQNGDTLLARITPCLENGKTAFVHGIKAKEGAVGSTEYIVMRSKKLNPYMVYLLSRTNEFRQYAVNSMSGSDGRQRVKADKLKALACLLPPAGLMYSFEQIASPMFEMVFSLNEQIFAAKQARDHLLPMLMKGEVEV